MAKKDRAFELFSQGKRPVDQEVKELGLKNRTLYAYYEEFKKREYATSNEDIVPDEDELAVLKKERTKLYLLSQIEEAQAKRDRLPDRLNHLERQREAEAEYLGQAIESSATLASIAVCIIRQHLLHHHYFTDRQLDAWDLMREAHEEVNKLRQLEPYVEKLLRFCRRQ
jgi:hypothetical protein